MEGSKPVSGGCASSNLGGVRAVIRGCAASSALNISLKKINIAYSVLDF